MKTSKKRSSVLRYCDPESCDFGKLDHVTTENGAKKPCRKSAHRILRVPKTIRRLIFAQTRARGGFVGGNGFRRVASETIFETLKLLLGVDGGISFRFSAPCVPGANSQFPMWRIIETKPTKLLLPRLGIRLLIPIRVQNDIAPFCYPKCAYDQFSI